MITYILRYCLVLLLLSISRSLRMVTNSRSRSSKLGWMVPASMHQTSQHDWMIRFTGGIHSKESCANHLVWIWVLKSWMAYSSFQRARVETWEQLLFHVWLQKACHNPDCTSAFLKTRAQVWWCIWCAAVGGCCQLCARHLNHTDCDKSWETGKGPLKLSMMWMEYLTEDYPRTPLDMALRKKKASVWLSSCHFLVEFASLSQHSCGIAMPRFKFDPNKGRPILVMVMTQAELEGPMTYHSSSSLEPPDGRGGHLI